MTAQETEARERTRGSERFHELLDEIGELHDKKQADYGRPADPFANVRASDDFGVEPWIGCMIRGNDKMRRIQTAAQGNNLQNESLKDSLMDLAVYSIIAVVLMEESEAAEPVDMTIAEYHQAQRVAQIAASRGNLADYRRRRDEALDPKPSDTRVAKSAPGFLLSPDDVEGSGI